MRGILRPASAAGAAGFRLAVSTAGGLVSFARRPPVWRGALALGMLLTVLLIHRRVYQYLFDDDRFTLDLQTLQVVQRPGWAAEGLDFSLMPAPKGKMSLLDPNLVEVVAEYYQRSPWVAEVRSVEKLYPNRVRVTVDLRRPAAAVALDRGVALVDADGVRLPGLYPRVPPALGTLPTIYGAIGSPAPAGTKWMDRAVSNGLTVAAALAEYRLSDACPISVIDVRNAGGRRDPRQAEIVLWTPARIPIHWGRPPDTVKYGEVSVAQKMENLRRVLATYPNLAGVRGVKIHFHSPFVEKALAKNTRR
ncbi:MAG: hypothetical protein HYY93_02835 [Planctomycetes bacterium]|nr:hypothetical protein [Planctomycetota bacterium]